MQVLLIEPYLTGSHRSWAEGLQKYSSHDIEILSMKGAYWKWRMHGGAVTLAGRFMESDFHPDLILATDMLDLTTFLSLTRRKTAGIPAAIYFHENQLTYPWSPDDRDVLNKRDNHYSFINYTSALAADTVFFNSRYHHDVFLSELPDFLKHFPDYNELGTVEAIRTKSSVLPLGLDLSSLNQSQLPTPNSQLPTLLWNHRWEFDKNPGEFFRLLYALDEKGLDFSVVILGENFSRRPAVFDEARSRLGEKIVQYGYVENFSDYARWLWQSDILPVTSNQDFFGISVVQAMYCNCYPLLPRRLAYPGHIPASEHDRFLYDGFEDLVDRTSALITDIAMTRKIKVRQYVERYDWSACIGDYDKAFSLLQTLRTHP